MPLSPGPSLGRLSLASAWGAVDGCEKTALSLCMGAFRTGSCTGAGHTPPAPLGLGSFGWVCLPGMPSPPAMTASRHADFFRADLPAPLRVRVAAGDVLYLPSGWYHFVEQEGGGPGGGGREEEVPVCIAVNLWYDMRWDGRHATYALADRLGELLRGRDAAEGPREDTRTWAMARDS